MFQLQIIEAAKSPRSRTLRQWDSSAQVWYKLIKKIRGDQHMDEGWKTCEFETFDIVYTHGVLVVCVYICMSVCVCIEIHSVRCDFVSFFRFYARRIRFCLAFYGH